MIGKISKGKGFGGTIGYVMEKDGAEFLDTNLAASRDDPAALAREMAEHAARERPGLKNPVLHVSLSAAPGERLTDSQWREVADAYREKMGLSDTQYVLVRHTDADHDHVHMVLNRVDFDGRTISDSNNYIRQERALDEIEHEMGLVRVREQMRQNIRKTPTLALDNLVSQRVRVNEDQLGRQIARYFHDSTEREAIKANILDDASTVFLGRDEKGRRLYSTREVVAEWQGLRESLTALTERNRLAERTTGGALDGGKVHLSDEQRVAVEAITGGRGLAVVTGYAGAGKSTMLDAARRAWEAQGKDVIGCAVAGKAAKGLQDSSGIESNTIASTLYRLDKGTLELSERSVLVVDEAGMVENRQLAQLAEHVRQSGGQLVMVGDSRQIRAVGRSGGFDMAREIAGETTIETVRRQSIDWQRDATVAFGQGRATEAAQAYIDHGRVTWAASRGSARAELVRDYVAEIEKGTNGRNLLAMAHARRDVAALNVGIREAMQARGKLGDEITIQAPRHEKDAHGNVAREWIEDLRLASGDRVVMTRNDRAVGLRNGEFGTVLDASEQGIRVRMDDGREMAIDLHEYGDVQHGYASTFHKAQGASIGEKIDDMKVEGKTFELLTPGMDAHLMYVGFTRHKADTQAYAGRSDFDDERDLVEALSRTPEPDGLDLDETDLAEQELEYADQRADLDRIAAATPSASQSRAEERVWPRSTEATAQYEPVRVLPGLDLAKRTDRLDGAMHSVPQRDHAGATDQPVRGVRDSDRSTSGQVSDRELSDTIYQTYRVDHYYKGSEGDSFQGLSAEAQQIIVDLLKEHRHVPTAEHVAKAEISAEIREEIVEHAREVEAARAAERPLERELARGR